MKSIRRKLVLLLTAAMTVVMLLGAWATYSAAKEEANTIFDYHLEQIALALRNQNFHGATEELVGEKSFEFVIRVWDSSGLTIYSSARTAPCPMSSAWASPPNTPAPAPGASMPCNTRARSSPSPSRPACAPGLRRPLPCAR